MSDASRKDDHVRLAMEQGTGTSRSRHFDEVRFVHHPLDVCDVAAIDLHTSVGEKDFELPFYINGMTGGSEFTGTINRALAIAAAETGITMASGSMSAYFKDPSTAATFTVLREENPHGVLFANLSANATPDHAREAVDLLEADGLQIHINPVQELVMPEGDREFGHWPRHIEAIVDAVSVPVIVKEVGCGMAARTVRQLADLGVRYVDVAGNGGTDFAKIENSRRKNQGFTLLNGWGQSAVASLIDTREVARDAGVTLLASGGVRTPLDVVKALALGASAVGVAGGFLATVREHGPEELIDQINEWRAQTRSIMALLGTRTVRDLERTDMIMYGDVRDFAEARGIDITRLATRSSHRPYEKEGEGA